MCSVPSPLFQGMTDRSVETIASLAEETRFESGSTLVREGDPGDRFLIIRDGSAVVDQGGHTIRELGSGDSWARSRSSTAARGARPSPLPRRSTRWRLTEPGSTG
jgi:CRP-like cAMP-binding protein